MLILTRYFTKEFFKIFGLCVASFVTLYLLVDLFERMNDMIKHQVPVWYIFKYFLCSIPMIVYQVCPLGMLLCTFITIGILVRNNEITALKAHGVSLYLILKVFFLISVCFFVFSLWLLEYMLPYTNQQVKDIKTVYIKGKKKSSILRTHHFWYRNKNTIYNIDFFDPEKNMLQKITILSFRPDFSIRERIDAKKGIWDTDKWIFKDGSVRAFHPDGTMTVTRFDTKTIPINKKPEEFKMSQKEGDEMSFSEIKGFIEKLRSEGYSSTSYEVDMHAKVSYSFINVIMALLGIPFALRIGRSGGMALGIAVSVAIGFGYWIFFGFCLSLGKGGAIPPFMSAWIANAAFGLFGMYMFLHVRQ